MGIFDLFKKKKTPKKNDEIKLIIRENEEHLCKDYFIQNPEGLSIQLNYTFFGQTPGKAMEGDEIIGFHIKELDGDINLKAEKWGFIISDFKNVSTEENKIKLEGNEILAYKHFSDESLFKRYLSKQITIS